MAVYTYDPSQVESIIGAMKRSRLRHCAIASGVLLAAAVVAFERPTWIFGHEERARAWVLAALFVFFVGPLMETVWRWNRRARKLEESLRATRVEVFPEGIGISKLRSVRKLARHEIRQAEEVAWGIYLRSRTRYRWIFVPANIAEFESLKRELSGLGIAIVPAAIPPNWEEVLGGILLAATMLCAIFAQSARLLAANLVVSALIGVGGFLILSANPENLPKMRWARFAVFLPVAMTAAMLWTALHG